MNKPKPPAIGSNIANYRKQKGMSMEELSKRSGVSKSMLSQIEQEKTNPTVITLWKISKALNVPMEHLLKRNSISQIEVLRKDDAPIFYSEDHSCLIRVNSPVHMIDNLELYDMTFKPRGKLCSMPHFTNAEEFLTVITGKFRVTSGDSSAILNEGDTGRYRADEKHSIENLTDQEAKAYLVVWLPQ